MRPCMTPEEWRDWSAANAATRNPVASPCVDCTWAFSEAMGAIGRCDGIPTGTGRPFAPLGPGALRRRELQAQASARYRARARAVA